MTSARDEPLLSVRDLHVSFGRGAREVKAVRGVSFEINKGETVALVGESGSGKSVTALSILQLLPYPLAHHPKGSITFRGQELIGAPESKLRGIRGDDISMVFQEPMTSLNPLHTIEKQVNEVLFLHKGLDRAKARLRTLELLRLVGIPEPEKRLAAYPHELSGGQRQRVMIAMALANDPDLLIADEPTTAVDVTIQAQLLKLLKEIQTKLGMALLLITHDLGIVRKMAVRVSVMTEGLIVEQGPTATVFDNPQHEYTRRLLEAEPKGHPVKAAPNAPTVMSGDDIKVWFPIKAGVLRRVVDHVKAVDGISLEIREGHTVGIVGESGSGKTTLGLALLRLIQSEGAIQFDGTRVDGMSSREVRPLRRQMQIVFQDPYGSLSPRLSIAQIVAEGLKVHELGKSEEEREAQIVQALEEVGIDPEARHRYPHEFSGGQRQRIAIARAMILKPRFVVLDEPTSALDMSVQAQIVDLLRDLQERYKLAYMFISHDLRVVRALADEVIVLKDGKVMEQGRADQIFDRPQHPYTQALMAAAFDLEAVETGVVRM
jgi:microcin C transport system ATP-binding protein